MPRPQEVMDRANTAWNQALARNIQRGKTYSQSVKIAQRAYNQVLRNYDKRANRTHT